MRKSCGPAIAVALWLLIPTPTTAQSTLPGTGPLVIEGDPAITMVDGINAFLLRETAAGENRRAGL